MTETILPLMPKIALGYFIDANQGNPLYLRATSIRNCLENINGHKNLIKNDIELTLEDLSKICEWTILAYFKKNGFVEHPWIPTVFSVLPPIYRIRILEELFNPKDFNKNGVIDYLKDTQDYYHKPVNELIPFLQVTPTKREKELKGFLLLIDKLAMAYLKNRERQKSIDFILKIYEDGFVNEIFKEQMLDRLDTLWNNIDKFLISVNLSEAKESLDKILPAIKEEDSSFFVTLFIAIITQND